MRLGEVGLGEVGLGEVGLQGGHSMCKVFVNRCL